MDEKYKELAQVVAIVDEYKIAINRGAEHGVKLGANFLIFGLGNRLTDPQTGEDLGILEVVRGRAKVVHVQEKLATLESSEVTQIPGTVRKFKRDSWSALLAGAGIEEIEEGAKSRMAEIAAKVGDIARPI